MPYTIEDYRREVARQFIHELTPEERLEGLPAKELASRLSPEERLAGLPAEERLAGLSAEQIEAYLKRWQKRASPSPKKKPKPRR